MGSIWLSIDEPTLVVVFINNKRSFFTYIVLLTCTSFDSRLYIAFSRAVIATFTVGCGLLTALFCICPQLLNNNTSLIELLKRVWLWASFVILVLLMQLWMGKKRSIKFHP